MADVTTSGTLRWGRRTADTIAAAATSPAGRVARQSIVYTIGAILPQTVSVVLLPVFTRYLTTADYGILAYAMTVSSIFSALGAFAIQPFIVRQYWTATKSGDVGQLLCTLFLFLLTLNLALLATAMLVLPWVFGALAIQVPFAPYVRLALCSSVMQTLALVPMSYFRATERPAIYVGLSVVASLVGAGGSLYLVVVAGLGVMGRFYGQLGADATMLAIHLVIMGRIGARAWRPAHIRQALAFCLPLIPAQLLAMVSSLSDRLILERWVPLSDLGLYSVAAALAAAAPLLTSGVYSAIQPQVFRLAADEELDGRMLVIKRYLVWLLMLMMGLIVALSGDLVTLLAGPAFRAGDKVAALLVVGILVQSFITNVPSQYLTAVGKTQFEAPSRLVGGLIGLAAMLVLVPRFGIYGAGVASIVTAVATLAAYAHYLRRKSSLAWRFDRDLVLLAAAAVAGGLVGRIDLSAVVLSAAAKVVLILTLGAVYLAWISGRGILAPTPSASPVEPT